MKETRAQEKKQENKLKRIEKEIKNYEGNN